MSSFSPGSTASCTVFLPGLVNHKGHLLLSIMRHVSTTLQMACWQRVGHATEWGIDLYPGIYGNCTGSDNQTRNSRQKIYTNPLPVIKHVNYSFKKCTHPKTAVRATCGVSHWDSPLFTMERAYVTAYFTNLNQTSPDTNRKIRTYFFLQTNYPEISTCDCCIIPTDLLSVT